MADREPARIHAPANLRLIALLGVALFGVAILGVRAVYRTSWLSEQPVSELAVPAMPDTRQTWDAPDVADADIRVLFLGNSHTAMFGLPRLVGQILEQAQPEMRVFTRHASSRGFLIEQWDDPLVQDELLAVDWDVIVLQAQKYSTSGQFEYPTTGAENFIKVARERGIRAVLFPEWGQLGNATEGARVHALHREIADRTGAVVAPVGMAWELAKPDLPNVNLYSADGNHASYAGAFLTACTIACTLTDHALPELTIESSMLDQKTQQTLAQLAWQACEQYPP